MKLTYRQAYDKIIDAYFRDEIQPCEARFCFCGTLAMNNLWYWSRGDETFTCSGYNGIEFEKMEEALFIGMDVNNKKAYLPEHLGYEDSLFSGMCAALEVLKQIHIQRGEIIDEPIKFKKRELAKSEQCMSRK